MDSQSWNKGIFREGTLADVDKALELIRQRVDWLAQRGLRQWNDGSYLQVYNREYFSERARSGELWVFAEAPGERESLLAVCVLTEKDPRWDDDRSACYVHNLATAPGNPGLGRSFLADLASLAARWGKRSLRLDCGVDSLVLNEYYRSAGFLPRGDFETGDSYRGRRYELPFPLSRNGGYDLILMDADDTLLDFQANEKASLTALFQELGLVLTEEIRHLYSQINHRYWEQLERGEISRQEVLEGRFALLFQTLGRQADGPDLERRYRKYLEQGSQVIAGALDLCRHLVLKGKRLCIVTNGVGQTQRRRLANSGIDGLIPEIFVSGEVGFQKPDLRFFEKVFQRLGAVDPQRTIILGDSLSSDIRGAHYAGIDSCWFNPSGRPFRKELFRPTWEIRCLEELEEIVDPQ